MQGDIIRLKTGSTKWYHSAARKQAIAALKNSEVPVHSLSGTSQNNAISRSPSVVASMSSPPKKKVCYEKIWESDNSVHTFHAEPPVQSDSDAPHGIKYCYYDENQQAMVPLQPGWAPGAKDDQDDESFFL